MNVYVGTGVDFIFGSTDINIEMESFVYVKDAIGNDITDIPGSFTVDASTKDIAPSFIRPRAMVGIGVCVGPLIIINLSTTYYIPDGAYVGLATGIIWWKERIKHLFFSNKITNKY